jgi:hypothetical protein
MGVLVDSLGYEPDQVYAPGELKADQLEALRAILPPTSEVARMLDLWTAADRRYWGAALTPCWLSSNIEPYGKAIGSWAPHSRTLNLVPMLFRSRRPQAESWIRGVLVHEACHQAQHQLYRHLDAAKGPRGKWTDKSHRCPSWSRACEDVIQKDGIGLFIPVWHRSSGNLWHPWVPASEDWMTWKRVKPSDTFEGRPLADFDEAKEFLPGGALDELLEELADVATPEDGKPGPGWGL